MVTITSPQVLRILERQRCLITCAQATEVGLSRAAQRQAVRQGHWVSVHRGVLALAGVEHTPEVALLAACLATEGRASHRSATWLHGLLPDPPATPEVTVPKGRNNGRDGIIVHRSAQLRPVQAPLVRGIPCTTPLQAVLDLAAVVEDGLDQAIDVALARRLFRIGRLETELARRSGRPGLDRLRAALCRRGYAGSPSPSVLESQVLRLLASAGITPLACEHPVGRYRLDFVLAPRLALEVDGYAYHANPEQMTRDERRRRRLRRQGWEIIVVTWMDVRDDPQMIIDEVRASLARHAALSPA